MGEESHDRRYKWKQEHTNYIVEKVGATQLRYVERESHQVMHSQSLQDRILQQLENNSNVDAK